MKRIEGIVRFKKSDSKDCVCCSGNHVYSKYISEIDSDTPIDIKTIIHNTLTSDKENKKVKITIEFE